MAGVGRGYRAIVVTGRWWVVAGWVGLTVFTVLVLPNQASGAGVADIGNLLPADSSPVAVAKRSLEKFPVPVLSDTTIVVHDPAGLDPLTRTDVVLWALMHDQASQQGRVPAGPGHIVAAVPVPIASRDTAVTYLYTSNGTSLPHIAELAAQYAAHFHNQPQVETYVTGLTPAQQRQTEYLNNWLETFEIASLVLIAAIVAIVFRSLTAPLAVLLAAAMGYLVAIRVLGVMAAALGFALPNELKPLIAALLLGVVTDYCVLFFFAFRDELHVGLHRLAAARNATASDGPIVAVAGLTVAGGTAALLAANFELFRAFGPALSLTVLIGLALSLTLVPSLMAILGHRLFLPWRPPTARVARRLARKRTASPLIRIFSSRSGGAVAAVLTLGLLIAAALPLTNLRLDMSFTSGLPSDDPVAQGAMVLEGSGIRGITSPTEVLVEGHQVAAQRSALTRLQDAIAAQPGVAKVLGPAQNPLPSTYGIVLSKDGDAARFIVIFDSNPLGADAISDLEILQSRLDGLAAQAGVTDVEMGISGETAIGADLAEITRHNLWITLVAALLIELAILVVYLRALVAPVVLLACSALGVGASLGLTVLLFQGVMGQSGLTFYAPFATAVLLVALGSDYNVFTVGSIWEQAADHPLSGAIARAMPATSRAVGTAGMILAATFAMVAIIPLETFRQVAFTMAVGLLIDTLFIRPILTPAMLTLLGSASSWPSRRIRSSRVPIAELREAAAEAARRRRVRTAGIRN